MAALSILLVDDDVVDRMAAKRALKKSDLRVDIEEVDLASQALAALGRRPFHCVLLDYHLPDGDALGILQRLSDPAISAPPVIILTHRGSESVAVELMKAGAADYLPKTELTGSRIAQCIRNALRVRDAEEAVRRAHADLEQRVVDRTAELEEANRRLLAEMVERRQAEERARHLLEQLAHVDRVSTLGEMAASLAHELHQPLGAIVNFVRGCQRGIDAGTTEPEAVSKVMERIVEQAERAAEIVRRLGNFAARRQPKKRPADLNELVREVAEMLPLGVRADDVRLEFELTEDLPPVSVDRIQIQQVLMNLVKNAIEAMLDRPPEERRLLVRTAQTSGGEVEAEVADRGCGVPEADLERIFESFVTTKEQGMGMGLAICRSILEAHGGRLSARRNDDGAGLTLRFDLPAAMPL